METNYNSHNSRVLKDFLWFSEQPYCDIDMYIIAGPESSCFRLFGPHKHQRPFIGFQPMDVHQFGDNTTEVTDKKSVPVSSENIDMHK